MVVAAHFKTRIVLFVAALVRAVTVYEGVTPVKANVVVDAAPVNSTAVIG